MDSEQPVSDVELIVADLHGPHAFGVTTEDGRRILVVDKSVPHGERRPRATAFCAYKQLAFPPN